MPMLLLALVLLAPASIVIAAEAAAPAPAGELSADPKIAQIERRLRSNATRLAAQRARRESIAASVASAEEGLAQLAAQLKKIEELTAASIGRESTSEIAELDAANEAVVPMQRKKREWTRTVTEGRRTLAAIDQSITSIEADRVRIERELDRAKAASGGLLAE